MRARSLAAGAALAGASVLLWATAAGAGESYDEFEHLETFVSVGGAQCKILMTSYRQGSTVYASTYMSSPEAACATARVTAGLELRTGHGDTVTAGSADEGPSEAVSAGGAVDLVRSTHSVTFAAGPAASYTLNAK
jgi:hypothetical protein